MGPICSAKTNSPSFAPRRPCSGTVHSLPVLSIGTMRPPSDVCLNTPRTRVGLIPILRIKRPSYWYCSSDTFVSFASNRSPRPSAGSDLRVINKIIGSTSSPSHSSGRANKSPSDVGAITSTTLTGGNWLGSRKEFLRLLRWPSTSSSRKIFFSSIRSGPFMPNAFAISRFAVSVGLSEIQSRISFFDGNLFMWLTNTDIFCRHRKSEFKQVVYIINIGQGCNIFTGSIR